jgi:hypothetical protein
MHPDIRVRESPIEGRGIFAGRLIPKGTTVWKLTEAPGTFVTHAELRRLPPDRRHLAYRYRDRYLLSSDGSEYMNHSCDPNTCWIDDETMVASRDIRPGDEVTFDYATSDVHVWWRAKWVCHCGAPGCRKIITGRDCLDPVFAERHRGHLPSWTVDFMQRHAGIRGRLSSLLYAGAEVVRQLRSIGRRSGGGGPSSYRPADGARGPRTQS